MKLISKLKKVAMEIGPLRILMRSIFYGLQKIRFKIRGRGIAVNFKTIIFSAYGGKSYVCSPKAVYEYMLQDDRFLDYQFVWIFDHPDRYMDLTKNRNTKLVRKGSEECERFLHAAKYWIFNFRAVDHWIPSAEQQYIQCWHGTPLKRLGYDITVSDNAMNSVKEIRSKYRTDAQRFTHLLSSCDFVTEKFSSAWNLEEFGNNDTILEIGYPRNDFLRRYTDRDVQRIKENLRLEQCKKKTILYAPTWRDNQHDADAGYVYDNPVDFDYLKRKLQDEYIILFRAHYLVADNFNFEDYEGFIYDVSKYDDINELYIVSDYLVTDYSSVFFDYAILKRPMFFYMYDMEEYRDEMRGFYLDVQSLPGSIVKTEKELAEAILSTKSEESCEDIDAFNEQYNKMNDGKASARLADIIAAENM